MALSEYLVTVVSGDGRTQAEHRLSTAEATLGFVEGLPPGTEATITTPDGLRIDVCRFVSIARGAAALARTTRER